MSELDKIRERWEKPNPHASAANSQRALKDIPILLAEIDRLQAIVDQQEARLNPKYHDVSDLYPE